MTSPSASTSYALGSRVVGGAVLCLAVLSGCGDSTSLRGYEFLDSLVAVRRAGDEVARTGVFHLPTGTRFEVLAVVRASHGDETVYFTDATSLEIGGSLVPSELLRPWPEGRRSRVRWFTIEGSPPFTDWQERSEFPKYYPVFRPEWGAGWTIPGDVRPRNVNLALGTDRLGPTSLGSARYHLRVEMYAPGSNLTPVGRYPSPAVVDDGAAIDERASGVVMTLSTPSTAASEVFGLPQVEGIDDGPAEETFTSLAGAGLLFSRAWVLRGILREAEVAWEDIDWQPIDLAAPESGSTLWGDQVQPGDLLRVGGRVVVAFRDSRAEDIVASADDGERPLTASPGVVDYSDLCLDYSRGAAVRPLGDVFAGGGDIEWAGIAQR